MTNSHGKTKGFAYFFISLMPPLLAITGVSTPVVSTTTGYSYSITDGWLLISYLICIFALAVNIWADRLDRVIAKRLAMLALIFYGIVLINAAVVYSDGVTWIYNRTLYDATGPHWVWGGFDAAWNKIASMDIQARVELISTKGIEFSIYPVGFFIIIFSVLSEAYFISLLLKTVDPDVKFPTNNFSSDRNAFWIVAIGAIILALALSPIYHKYSSGISSNSVSLNLKIDKQPNEQVVTAETKKSEDSNGTNSTGNSNKAEKQQMPETKQKNLSSDGKNKDANLSIEKYREIIEGIK